jgi:nucleotide-binding universal stress UspA family protein
MKNTPPLSEPSDPQLGRQYSAFTTEWEPQPTAGTASGTATATRAGTAPLFLVVGFDGSKPAQRALDSAAGLLHDREGALEVVYVAHIPAGAELSSDAMIEIENALDDQEARLAGEVRSRLQASEPRWHFQRRDGAVIRELIAVADRLRRQHGPTARIAVVVGGSAHKYHRFVGSVSMDLERVDRFPVLVVP